MRTVIGICGAAGSGKDAAAAVLIARRGFKKRSFAQALREEVRLAMVDSSYRESIWPSMPDIVRGWFDRCYESGDLDPWAKPTSPDMRGLLQTWGTEFRRAQDIDYWAKRAVDALPPNGSFVFTDVRFWNEYDAIRQMSGSVWRVERTGVAGNGHVSESYWPHFSCDAVIRNDGTVDDLKQTVLRLCTTADTSSS